jgi:hypothetical protein
MKIFSTIIKIRIYLLFAKKILKFYSKKAYLPIKS